MNLTSYRTFWDKLSAGASIACAIHCILLPLLFTTFPVLGFEIIKNIFLETITISISLTAGGWAIWKGYYNHHHSITIVYFFTAGVLLMVGGNFIRKEVIEMSFKLMGAASLITAHIKNWRTCKRCNACKVK